MDMQLSNLIGRRVVVLGPKILGNGTGTEDHKLETVTLVGVESAGIWVESEPALNRIADRFGVKPAVPAALFIPFADITTILASNTALPFDSEGKQATP
jgi:hypothetical protein